MVKASMPFSVIEKCEKIWYSTIPYFSGKQDTEVIE
jgi:hypothetical protein